MDGLLEAGHRYMERETGVQSVARTSGNAGTETINRWVENALADWPQKRRVVLLLALLRSRSF